MCAGSAPGTARGPASHTPAAADPSIRRRGLRRNRLVRADVTSHSRRGAPGPRGRTALGWAQRKEPPGGHSPRALSPPPPLPPRWPPRLAARPAAPKRGGASARRRARSAPGRLADSGSPSWPPRPLHSADPSPAPARALDLQGFSLGVRLPLGCMGQGLLPSGQRMEGALGRSVPKGGAVRTQLAKQQAPKPKGRCAIRHRTDCIHGAEAVNFVAGTPLPPRSGPNAGAGRRPAGMRAVQKELCTEACLQQSRARPQITWPPLASPPKKVSAETATRPLYVCYTGGGVTLFTRREDLKAGASGSSPKSGV